jgi:hypothetical protein
MMTTGMTLTTAFVVAVSSVTGHYLTAVQIDGAAVPVKWQSGLAPSVGTAGGYDIYTFTLIKTSTGFLVFGSQTSYF